MIVGLFFLNEAKHREAREVFGIIAPIATGIITYWFTSHSSRNSQNETDKNNQKKWDTPDHKPDNDESKQV